MCRADHSSTGVLRNVVCLSVIVKRREWGCRSPLGAAAQGGGGEGGILSSILPYVSKSDLFVSCFATAIFYAFHISHEPTYTSVSPSRIWFCTTLRLLDCFTSTYFCYATEAVLSLLLLSSEQQVLCYTKTEELQFVMKYWPSSLSSQNVTFFVVRQLHLNKMSA
jgi:hypothetical protein